MIRIFLAALGLLAASLGSGAVVAAAPPSYPPRDECTRVPGATAFRAALATAIQRRDAAAIGALAASDLMLDFGGGAGRAELTKRLRGSEGPGLWRELTALLALGCAVQGNNLVLPSFNSDDLGEQDAFAVLLVTGANVPLYARRSTASRQLATVSWQLVKPLPDNRLDLPLQYVQLVGSNLTGYIAQAKLRSQMGYRLVAKRVGGRWRISAFISGD